MLVVGAAAGGYFGWVRPNEQRMASAVELEKQRADEQAEQIRALAKKLELQNAAMDKSEQELQAARQAAAEARTQAEKTAAAMAKTERAATKKKPAATARARRAVPAKRAKRAAARRKAAPQPAPQPAPRPAPRKATAANPDDDDPLAGIL